MDRVSGVWRKLGVMQRVVAVAMPIALVVAIVGGAAFALATAPRETAIVTPPGSTPAPSLPPLPPDPTLAPDASPIPTPTPPPPGADPLLGTDGRLTVLLLGSDYRPAHPGNRTDAIMVVSLDPTTGKAAGISIPRDTSRFPLGNGSTYGPKVNALYEHLQSRTGNGGLAMRKAVAKAFDIEIDGYVFIGFEGVKDLVAAVGGVDVTLDKPYYDAHYWVNASHQGWGLPAGTSHLGPKDALIFARSRKGDNDFGRARRQQILVLAALDKARSRGIAKLPRLLQIASRTVRTDLPLDRAADLFDIVSKTDISKVQRTVFGPTTYASGTAGGSFELKLRVCRDWIKANFPAIRPMGQWPAVPPAAASPPASSAP
jgi:polyisoprenyl-teichoic acid--peptidoglycan teichoic acid transferase